MGPLQIKKEMVVADIEDDALLGCNVLAGSKDGPADILLSKNVIIMVGKEIPRLPKLSRKGSRNLTVADDVTVPAKAEALVDVYIERVEEDDANQEVNYLVEATDTFKGKYQLAMAATLVNINRTTTNKVRFLNPHPAEMRLRQNAVVGTAERIEAVTRVITEKEHKEEKENICRVRRVQTDIVGSIKPEIPFETAEEHAVPEHLKVLYKKSTENKSEHEKKVIAGLLLMYGDVFSKHEWDLGITNFAEHPINTGDATPIKQRPRRVPLAYAEDEKMAIEDLLQKGVIRKSTSPWASPVVLVRKKSGAIRRCINQAGQCACQTRSLPFAKSAGLFGCCSRIHT
ncbi:uncharacterized protein LOC128553493 [Mercenaria mercenaria]|uniref:uncharacterized protein LOC128553493 n=1 Tax=Mercenaria mercenaria TaxID=6596 RepID=UPI00234EE824|nr:uncharacterized protein LOC128553493 [Mercenaria mercenaria]